VHFGFRLLSSGVSIAKGKGYWIALAVQPHVIDGPTVGSNGRNAFGRKTCAGAQSGGDPVEYCVDIPAQTTRCRNGRVRKAVNYLDLGFVSIPT
jgi:hypothetical protein